MEKTLKMKEAASFLGVSPSTLRKWCEARKIRFVRTLGGKYRIPEGEVLRLQREMGLSTQASDREILESLNPEDMVKRKIFGELLDVVRQENIEFSPSTLAQGTGFPLEYCLEFCRRLKEAGVVEVVGTPRPKASPEEVTYRLRR